MTVQQNDPQLMQLFADAGAVVSNSHFVYTSGRHSSVYINKDALYVHTGVISQLCRFMAQSAPADQIDVVVGPVLGGIILSQWVTHFLNASRTSGETLAVYAEKDGEGPDKTFSFRRGYDAYIPGKNILIVEDILTTGGSVRQVIETVRHLEGNVVAVSALCNRGNVQPSAIGNVPIQTLISVDLQTYTAETCPFCAQQIPINTALGKGKAFLAQLR